MLRRTCRLSPPGIFARQQRRSPPGPCYAFLHLQSPQATLKFRLAPGFVVYSVVLCLDEDAARRQVFFELDEVIPSRIASLPLPLPAHSEGGQRRKLRMNEARRPYAHQPPGPSPAPLFASSFHTL